MTFTHPAEPGFDADYAAPFAYPGTIRLVTFELPEAPPELARAADRAEVMAAGSRQQVRVRASQSVRIPCARPAF